MKLIKGATYTNSVSDLAIRILTIPYESDTHYTVKGQLIIKNGKHLVESKYYKLDKNLIKDWELYEG